MNEQTQRITVELCWQRLQRLDERLEELPEDVCIHLRKQRRWWQRQLVEAQRREGFRAAGKPAFGMENTENR